jgi:4-hydroxy-2-oxoheptanedioate aldolase
MAATGTGDGCAQRQGYPLREEIMKKNLLKERWKKESIAVGVVVQEAAVESVEILGLMGFDFLIIDCQSFPVGIENIVQVVRAAELRGMTPLVRLSRQFPEAIPRYLNTGIMGVVVDCFSAAEEVQDIVRVVKYPPDGERIISSVRAADFGMRIPLDEYTQVANQETVIIGVVKSKEGVEEIDAIISVEGLDAVFVDGGELANSLGVPGQKSHPWVTDALTAVIASGKSAGKAVGAAVRFGEMPKEYIEQGFQMVTTSLPGLIVGAATRFLENARG